MDNFDAHRDKVFSYMEELSSIYKSVKPLILLSEYYNSSQGIVLSTINELRNSFDHIMRSFFDSTKTDEEFFKAKGHLFRAAFDACEIIIIDRLEYINQFKESVGFNSLYNACPQYYTEILPFISDVKEKLVSLRQNPNTPERINEYEKIVTCLIETCDTLNKSAPSISARYKRNDKTLNKQISLITALLGMIGIVFSVLSIFDFSVLLIISLTGLSCIFAIAGLYFFRKK